MDHHITASELLGFLAVLWVPVFGAAAVLHWQLLSGRRRRIVWVGGAFVLGVALALGIWASPLNRLFLYSVRFGSVLGIARIPIQAALLSALLVTLALLLLRRLGLLHDRSLQPPPVRRSA